MAEGQSEKILGKHIGHPGELDKVSCGMSDGRTCCVDGWEDTWVGSGVPGVEPGGGPVLEAPLRVVVMVVLCKLPAGYLLEEIWLKM